MQTGNTFYKNIVVYSPKEYRIVDQGTSTQDKVQPDEETRFYGTNKYVVVELLSPRANYTQVMEITETPTPT